MQRTTSIWIGLTMFLVLSGVALLPAASGQPEPPFVTMKTAGTSVMWETQSSSAQMVLSVSGSDIAIRQVNTVGGVLALSLTRSDGTPLPDGTYNWEIRESFPGINDGVYDPANGRDAVDPGSAQTRIEVEGRVQSGVFTIKNGFVIDGTQTDETAPKVEAAAGKEGQ